MLDDLVGEVVTGTPALLDQADQPPHRLGQFGRRPLGGDRQAGVGRRVQPSVPQHHPGRDVPGGGHRFHGPGRQAGGDRVVEQRDQSEHHGGPQGVRHAVQVADLQPLPRAHRREQRGQVVLQVGDSGPAAAQQHPPVHPVGERHPARDRLGVRGVHQHHRGLERVARPVGARVVAASAQDGAAARRVHPPPHPLPAGHPAGEIAVQHRRVGRHRNHGGAQGMCQPHPRRPAFPRPGVHVDLNRHRGCHHCRARLAGAAGGEEPFHGAVAGAGVDPLGRPQRVGTQKHQTQPGLGERGPQHGLVAAHGVDGRQHAVGRRAGQLDGPARLHRDPAAAGQRGQRVEHRGDLVPARPAARVLRVVAVGFDFQTHPAQRRVRQTAPGDVMRDGRGVGQLGDLQLDRRVATGRPRSRHSARGERHITIPPGPTKPEHAPADRFPAQLIER